MVQVSLYGTQRLNWPCLDQVRGLFCSRKNLDQIRRRTSSQQVVEYCTCSCEKLYKPGSLSIKHLSEGWIIWVESPELLRRQVQVTPMITIIFSFKDQLQHHLASPGRGFPTWLVSLVQFSQGKVVTGTSRWTVLNLLPCLAWNSLFTEDWTIRDRLEMDN